MRRCTADERAQLRCELLGRCGGEVASIHPLELLRIEDGALAVDVVEREARDELSARQDLFIRARRPAEQRKKIEQRFGQDSLIAVLADGGSAVPLRQPLAVRAEN